MKKLKIIFAGTACFSAEHLNALINMSYQVIAVITPPDKPYGRGQKMQWSSVKIVSKKNNIPVFQPLHLNEKTFQNDISILNADIMIVVAYGKILPKIILSMFPMGCINVHPSLLPRWRGATPIQSAIIHGDKITGITIIEMNEMIDTGQIIHSETCNILPNDTTYTLSLKLMNIGVQSLLKTLKNIINKKIIKKQQNEKKCLLSYKINKKDGLLKWNQKAITLERIIRAFNPWPTAYFKKNNTIIKIWEAEVIPIHISTYSIGEIIATNQQGIQVNTAYQVLNIKKLQISGKKIITSTEMLLSKKHWFNIGTILK